LKGSVLKAANQHGFPEKGHNIDVSTEIFFIYTKADFDKAKSEFEKFLSD